MSARGLLVVVIAVGLGGCLTPGRHGVLAFGYEADDSFLVTSMDAAVAAGEECEVVVYTRGEQRHRIDVTAATSADPGVLQVVAIDGARIRLRGVRAGGSDLRVTTAQGTDLIQLRVRNPGQTKLDHWAWREGAGVDASQTALLAGGTLHLLVTRRGEGGELLVGYGAGASARVEPEGAGTIVNGPEDGHHLRVAVAAGAGPRLAIRPRGGAALELDVIGADQIASLEVRGDILTSARVDAPLPVGEARTIEVAALLADGRRALALDGILAVESASPRACRVTPLQDVLVDGVFSIVAAAAGDCEIVARAGAHTATLRLAIVRAD